MRLSKQVRTIRNAIAIAVLGAVIVGTYVWRSRYYVDLDAEAAFHNAMESDAISHVDGLAPLLREHRSMVRVKDSHGATLLHYAAYARSKDAAALLISFGAAVDAPDLAGRTPLDWALEANNGVAELLLAKGAHLNIYQAAALGERSVVASFLARDEHLINSTDRNGLTALQWAVQRGKTQTAELLLSKGAKVDVRTPVVQHVYTDTPNPVVYTGRLTPLHEAAAGGHKDIVALLLAHGANVNARDVGGRTPLFDAGQTDVMEALLAGGADIAAKNTNGDTRLHELAMEGQTNLGAFLLAHGANPNIKTPNGSTPLDYAWGNGQWEFVRLLIQNGATMGAGRMSLNDLFLSAARAHRWDFARECLAHGADVNVRDAKGESELHRELFVEFPDKELIAFLAGMGAIYDIFDVAALGDVVRTTKLLEDSPALIGAVDKTGRTALHWAASKGQTNIVTLLLDRGANPNAKQRSDETPLHFAIEAEHVEVARLLLAKGADANARAGSALTPLHLAVMQGSAELSEVLIASGADVNARDYERETPLLRAARDGALEIAKMLIAKGATVNVRDSEGETPLHYACHNGHRDVVELLLAAGTDVNAKDNLGRTPLRWLMTDASGDSELVTFLKSHGGRD